MGWITLVRHVSMSTILQIHFCTELELPSLTPHGHQPFWSPHNRLYPTPPFHSTSFLQLLPLPLQPHHLNHPPFQIPAHPQHHLSKTENFIPCTYLSSCLKMILRRTARLWIS